MKNYQKLAQVSKEAQNYMITRNISFRKNSESKGGKTVKKRQKI